MRHTAAIAAIIGLVLTAMGALAWAGAQIAPLSRPDRRPHVMPAGEAGARSGLVARSAAASPAAAHLPASALPRPVGNGGPAPGGVSDPRRAAASYAHLPLCFEANHGQTDARVKFLARGSGYTLFLTGDEAVLSLRKADCGGGRAPGRAERRVTGSQCKAAGPRTARNTQHATRNTQQTIRMQLLGADRGAPVGGLTPLPGKANYFLGSDPRRWRVNVPTYAQVRYGGVYPGIDMVYYGSEGRLEYDFVVAPGADPGSIRMALAGADNLHVARDGSLAIRAGGAEVRLRRPAVYQEMQGRRRPVSAGYVVEGAHRVGFRVAAYDRRRPLVIDPVLEYATYLGGAADDRVESLAVDTSGALYLAGSTASLDFPVTDGALPGSNGGRDAFVAKMSPGGGLGYSTYLGGAGEDQGRALAVDATGCVYVAGDAASADFPVTAGAFQTTYAGASYGGDAFLAKLSATGSALEYATYLGGRSTDAAAAVAVDGSGRAFVAGYTQSNNFPTTVGAFQRVLRGECNGFVTQVNPDGASLGYATYLGGAGWTIPDGLAIDAAGCAYVAGGTNAANFPVTTGAFQTARAGLDHDAFVTKVSADGRQLVYSTYLGGTGYDGASTLALDVDGCAYVAGLTYSGNFPVAPSAFQPAFGSTTGTGNTDAFVTKVSADGSALAYSSFLGGAGREHASSLTVDAQGCAYVAGGTNSTDFPATASAFQREGGGGQSAFLAKVGVDGATLEYATYLGGRAGCVANALALGDAGRVHVGGVTYGNFPITAGALQEECGGVEDAFLATITPDALPARLAFEAAPGSARAGAALTPVRVVVQDAEGNNVTSRVPVTLALQGGPEGAVLQGITTVNALAGMAAFTTLHIDEAGTGYALTATAPGLQPATCSPFAVTAAQPSRLAFDVQPRETAAGAILSPAVQVRVLDAFDNTTVGQDTTVVISLASHPSGGTLSGTRAIRAVEGVATFLDLSINKAGDGYHLAATATSLAGATSEPFAITSAAAARLAFATAPARAIAGAAMAPAIRVTVLDAHGNMVTTSTRAVSIALKSNPAGGTLAGTLTRNAAGGVATFADLALDRAGAGYTLEATSEGITAVTSPLFVVVPGSAARLAFVAQPSTGCANTPIAPAVRVAIQDRLGNTVAAAAQPVTVWLAANPTGAALSGTKTVVPAQGVAAFTNLVINRPGRGYLLAASAPGLSAATSAVFDATTDRPTRLAFVAQPSDVGAGSAVSPAVAVDVQDRFGNTVPTTGTAVTVTLGANPGGAALSGTRTVAAAAGMATFTQLSLDKVGRGYTLVASSPGLASATSASFSVTAGTPARLEFTAQPTDTAAGAPITPDVRVSVLDRCGNRVDTARTVVTLSLATNPGGSTLSGRRTAAAASGIATFAGLSLDRAGLGYRLLATADGLSSAQSARFAVIPGAAKRLAFRTQPQRATAGSAIGPAVQVAVQDQFGNTVPTGVHHVSIALGSNPAGGSLSGTTAVDSRSGVATFAGLKIVKAGPGYSLSASAPGLESARSALFDVGPGLPTRLAFAQQPLNTAADAPIAPAVKVTVLDRYGNQVRAATAPVTVALGANPGHGALSGRQIVNAAAGVATFPTLRVNKTGARYTLVATNPNLAPATSAPFDVTSGAPAKLAFSVQPHSTVAGRAIAPAVRVSVQDRCGNLVATASTVVTLALGRAPGGGTLADRPSQAAMNGIATFSGLSVDKAGKGYTLVAEATGLTPATSTPFDITAGSSLRLAFITQPPASITAAATMTPAVRVAIQDALGNTVSTANDTVTLALRANPGHATLTGTATVRAVSGVATFGGLRLDKAGQGYTLSATAAGRIGATSAPFAVVPGAAARLAFTRQPTNVTAGDPFSVTVAVLDAHGNRVPTDTREIRLYSGSLDAGGGVGEFGHAVNGEATFTDLRITVAGTYWLDAYADGLTSAKSVRFVVARGAPAGLTFGGRPQLPYMAGKLSPGPAVAVVDRFGNGVPTPAYTITLSLNSTNGAVLEGTTTVTTSGAAARFNNVTITKAGPGYTFTATAAGLPPATSWTFGVSPSVAASLTFVAQPQTSVAGAPIAPAVQVAVWDRFGNAVNDYPISVTIRLETNPGGGTLSGTTTAQTSGGVATFANLSLNTPGTGYTLKAAAYSLTVSSAPFDVAPRAAPRRLRP